MAGLGRLARDGVMRGVFACQKEAGVAARANGTRNGQQLRNKHSMTNDQLSAIECNLFPSVRGLVRERVGFPWHRGAHSRQSSQAVAIDVFETVNRLPSRNQIVGAWAKLFRLPAEPRDNWDLTLEYTVHKTLLGEPQETQIDVLAKSESGIIVFECKFTEADGGACSQVNQRGKGAHEGMAQCNGNYEEQVNPINGKLARCALTAKGVRYWDLIPDVMNIDPNVDHTPCPVAGGSYQWMRNLAAARALSLKAGVPAAFGLVYADGPFPMAKKLNDKKWKDRLTDSVAGRAVHLEGISYHELIRVARDVAIGEDAKTLKDLSDWVQGKFDEVGKRMGS